MLEFLFEQFVPQFDDGHICVQLVMLDQQRVQLLYNPLLVQPQVMMPWRSQVLVVSREKTIYLIGVAGGRR